MNSGNIPSCAAAALVAVLIAAPIAARAQGAADWNAVVAKAGTEGKVVLYANIVPPILARLRAEFEKTYPGIKLEYTRITAAPDVLSKVDQEHAGGLDTADVVISTDGATHRWYEERAKEKVLVAPAGPNARTWPAKYWLRGGMTPILALEPNAIIYNTEFVKSSIAGYRDLLRPEFKDHLGTSDIISPTIASWYVWLEKVEGADFMPKFAAQHPRLYNGSVPDAQAAASGEILAAAFAAPTTADPLIEAGAKLKIVVPNPSYGIAYTTATFTFSRRPNAAQLLVNYLLSPQWQEIWSGHGETASPRAGTPGSLDPETVDTTSAIADSPEAVARYKDHWSSLFRKN